LFGRLGVMFSDVYQTVTG